MHLGDGTVFLSSHCCIPRPATGRQGSRRCRRFYIAIIYLITANFLFRRMVYSYIILINSIAKIVAAYSKQILL